MDTNIRLTTAQSPSTTADFALMRDVPYREAVGSLMYAALSTCPDIAFTVQTVSHFSTKPGPAHWEAVKRIFRYLKGTSKLWLSYGMKDIKLTGYTDADGSMAEDRHAISGYAFLIHGGAVSWSAKRQEIIALSAWKSGPRDQLKPQNRTELNQLGPDLRSWFSFFVKWKPMKTGLSGPVMTGFSR